MTLYRGTNTAQKLYVGTTQVQKAYIGATQVFEAAAVPPVSGAVEIGTLTQAGNAVAHTTGTSITSGNESGYFSVSGNKVYIEPAGVGNLAATFTLVFNDLSEIVLTGVTNTYTVSSLANLDAALQLANANSQHIFDMLDGDYTAETGMFVPTTKRFTVQQQIIGRGFVDNANLTLRTYGTFLPGINLGPLDFVDVYDCDIYSAKDVPGASTSGVVILRGANNGIHRCKVHSKDFLVTMFDDPVEENTSFRQTGTSGMPQTNGISFGSSLGLQVTSCHIYSTARSVGFYSGGGSATREARFSENWCEIFYTNWSTYSGGLASGATGKVKIWNNRFLGSMGHTGDKINAGSAVSSSNTPHTSLGLSGDPRENIECNAFDFRGNLGMLGDKRKSAATAAGYTGVGVTLATGAKANDPNQASYSAYPGNGALTYTDGVWLANICCARGPNGMVGGARDFEDAGNAFITDPSHGGNSTRTLDSVANMKFYNNLYESFDLISEFDAGLGGAGGKGVGYHRTSDSISGFNNIQATSSQWQSYFQGISGKGFSNLEIWELDEAFTPVSGSLADSKGIGPKSSAYNPNTGEYTYSTYNDLTPSAGADGSFPLTYQATGVSRTHSWAPWGSSSANHSLLFKGKLGYSSNAGTILNDNRDEWEFSITNTSWTYRQKNTGDTVTYLQANGTIANSPHEDVCIVISVDYDNYNFQVMVNGEIDPMPTVSWNYSSAGSVSFGDAINYLLTDYQNTDPHTTGIGLLGIKRGLVLDLANPTTYAKLVNGNGMFPDLGVDGAAIDGSAFDQWYVSSNGSDFLNSRPGGVQPPQSGLAPWTGVKPPSRVKYDMFDVAQISAGSSDFRVTVHELPDMGTEAPTGISYSVDAGQTWIDSGYIGPFTAPLTFDVSPGWSVNNNTRHVAIRFTTSSFNGAIGHYKVFKVVA